MLIDIVPSVLMLLFAIWFLSAHRKQPVIQFYTLILVSYLCLFPLLNYLLSDGWHMETFSYYQWIIFIFFLLPLLIAAHFVVGRPLRTTINRHELATLSPLLPWLILLVLAIFWYVALNYDLFFRRIGHNALQENSARVPKILLYIYRMAVETSFFVLMFMWTVVYYVKKNIRHYFFYKWTLCLYLSSFIVFYIANSRMHLILLMVCALCTVPGLIGTIQIRVRLVGLLPLFALVLIGLTLLRELILEDNSRIETENFFDMIKVVLWMIAARLDSLVILHDLDRAGFIPWRFDLTGIIHSLTFTVSFFTDSQAYNAVKESLITSPSVFVVNRLLGSAEVDFPKSMALDTLLNFGVIGLSVVGVLLGILISRIQRNISSFRDFKIVFLLSLYILPMQLEFEKEFLGFFFSIPKWFPLFLVFCWLRPRLKRLDYKQSTTVIN